MHGEGGGAVPSKRMQLTTNMALKTEPANRALSLYRPINPIMLSYLGLYSYNDNDKGHGNAETWKRGNVEHDFFTYQVEARLELASS